MKSTSDPKFYMLGVMPPPLGGVSVYCLRKYEMLLGEGVSVYFLDAKYKLRTLLWLLFIAVKRSFGAQVRIEVNVSNFLALSVLLLLGLTSVCTFVDHNASRSVESGRFKLFVFVRFIRKIYRVILVNEDLKNLYIRLNLYTPSVFSVMSPYLPPSQKELDEAAVRINKKFPELLSGDEKRIIFSSAFKPVFTSDEGDLYGLLETLTIFERLLPRFKGHKFVLLIGEPDDSEFFNEVQEFIYRLHKFNNFYYLSGGFSQLSLLPHSRVMLRLTKTDGDSIGIREALSFGVTVVASDVAPRPNEVIIVNLDDNMHISDVLADILMSGS